MQTKAGPKLMNAMSKPASTTTSISLLGAPKRVQTDASANYSRTGKPRLTAPNEDPPGRRAPGPFKPCRCHRCLVPPFLMSRRDHATAELVVQRLTSWGGRQTAERLWYGRE
ncbi:hypothetical protein KRMM14A1259_63000 [Krasilnikovia sp. MM14-A1259]